MNEMVERAARALCVADNCNPDAVHDGEPAWKDWAADVITVIAAMREPTQEMLWAGSGSSERDATCASSWRAMIDAALK